ncbi:MAG: single-stranded DNA-binding protein [bacterium]|nr:single-stranded DNA-binding protein [bacterium]
MLNRCVLIGRLTRDPERRFTQSGKCVTSFNLAVDRKFTNANGEKQADFIGITAWGKLAEIVCDNLNKGRLVAVDGRIQSDSYTDKNSGDKRTRTGVVAEDIRFLDWPKDNTADTSRAGNAGNAPSNDDYTDNYEDCTLDDMPF